MDSQAKHKGRSLRCPRCQFAFTISTTPVRCPRCHYLIPHEFVEAQSGCLTNFGIGLAMGIGCALWASALLMASSSLGQRHSHGDTMLAFAMFGFIVGAIVGWVVALTMPRTTAERLTLYVCSTGVVALITAALGASILIAILVAIVIGCPMAALIWRLINAHITAQA